MSVDTNDILKLVDLMLAASNRFAALGSIYRAMRAEGRTKLTAAEWDAVLAADDSADAKLAADIARAKAEGR
jgi:hypothetical protein